MKVLDINFYNGAWIIKVERTWTKYSGFFSILFGGKQITETKIYSGKPGVSGYYVWTWLDERGELVSAGTHNRLNDLLAREKARKDLGLDV